MKTKPRLLRITTVPISLKLLLNGQLSYFRKQGYEVLAVSADGPEIAALEAEGIDHQIVPMTRKITPLRDLVSLFGLIRVIRRFKPDIVHTHTPKAGLIGMLAAWICRTPIRLHTVAGLPLMEAHGLKRKVLVVTEKLTYGLATGVYVNSQGLRSYIDKQITTNNTKIGIIGKGSSNGIHTDYYRRTEELEQQTKQLRQQHHIGSQDIVFSFVGRIVKDKGIGEAIAAFKRLIAAHPSQKIFFLLIGHFEQELDPLSSEDHAFLHTSDRVILAGFQHDVRPWIMASDVFVFPSYREGFPNVVLQACCLEVPCIVSDINGCNEIVKHHKTGIIVAPKDDKALYEAMQLMISDRNRIAYARAAREYVVANFDQQYVWATLRQEYEKLLGLS